MKTSIRHLYLFITKYTADNETSIYTSSTIYTIDDVLLLFAATFTTPHSGQWL